MLGGRSEQSRLRTRNSNVNAVSTVRFICSNMSFPKNNLSPGRKAQNEMDSNANTCCLGSKFIILEFTNRYADVYPYDKSYGPAKNIPIVTGATAWTDPLSNETYILVFNESLYYGTSLPHSLINPNQVRHHGINVQDNPFDRNNEMGIMASDDIFIAMSSLGTKISFTSRAPTDD